MKNTKKLLLTSFTLALVSMSINLYFLLNYKDLGLINIGMISISISILVHFLISRTLFLLKIIKRPSFKINFIGKVVIGYVKGFISLLVLSFLLSITSTVGAIFIYVLSLVAIFNSTSGANYVVKIKEDGSKFVKKVKIS